MTMKNKKPSRLAQAILETAKDMRQVGVLDDAAYDKITMRHPGHTLPVECDPPQGHGGYSLNFAVTHTSIFFVAFCVKRQHFIRIRPPYFLPEIVG
jgi:hypothetical protein